MANDSARAPSRRPSFLTVARLAGETEAAAWVIALVYFRAGERGWCHADYYDLSAPVCVSRRTARRAVRQAAARGFLRVDADQRRIEVTQDHRDARTAAAARLRFWCRCDVSLLERGLTHLGVRLHGWIGAKGLGKTLASGSVYVLSDAQIAAELGVARSTLHAARRELVARGALVTGWRRGADGRCRSTMSPRPVTESDRTSDKSEQQGGTESNNHRVGQDRTTPVEPTIPVEPTVSSGQPTPTDLADQVAIAPTDETTRERTPERSGGRVVHLELAGSADDTLADLEDDSARVRTAQERGRDELIRRTVRELPRDMEAEAAVLRTLTAAGVYVLPSLSLSSARRAGLRRKRQQMARDVVERGYSYEEVAEWCLFALRRGRKDNMGAYIRAVLTGTAKSVDLPSRRSNGSHKKSTPNASLDPLLYADGKRRDTFVRWLIDAELSDEVLTARAETRARIERIVEELVPISSIDATVFGIGTTESPPWHPEALAAAERDRQRRRVQFLNLLKTDRTLAVAKIRERIEGGETLQDVHAELGGQVPLPVLRALVAPRHEKRTSSVTTARTA